MGCAQGTRGTPVPPIGSKQKATVFQKLESGDLSFSPYVRVSGAYCSSPQVMLDLSDLSIPVLLMASCHPRLIPPRCGGESGDPWQGLRDDPVDFTERGLSDPSSGHPSWSSGHPSWSCQPCEFAKVLSVVSVKEAVQERSSRIRRWVSQWSRRDIMLSSDSMFGKLGHHLTG